MRCLASAGSSVSPVLGGAGGGALKRVLLHILNKAWIRGKSVGLVVYLGGDVRMELALPTSPCCVSVSTRCASFVSSGGSACGAWVGSASVSSVSHDPFQNRNSLCASVVFCEAVSLCLSGLLFVCSSNWSMWISSFHKRVVSGLFGSWCSGRASSLITVAFASWYALRKGRGICVHVLLGLSKRSS